jgi:group I intron endonuclease
MMAHAIYKIINLVNNKFYVGSTVSTKVRFRQHRKLLRANRHHCKHLQAAWNKYGEDKFTFQIVEEVPSSRSLQEVEEIYLAQHVGKSYCYNTGRSADAPWRNAPAHITPNFGRLLREDQRQHISQKLKAFYAENYYNHPRVGKIHSEATRAKISAAKLANPVKPWLGKVRSEETKAKIGDTQRSKPKGPGRRISDAGRAKIMAAAAAGRYSHWTGRTHTEEAKQKMRKQIDATDPQGTVHRYGSLTETLQSLELLMPTLNRALKSGKPLSKGRRMGWSFKYVDTLSTT